MARADWVGTKFRVLEGVTLGAIDLGYVGGDEFVFTKAHAEKYDPEVWLAMPVVELVGGKKPPSEPSVVFSDLAVAEAQPSRPRRTRAEGEALGTGGTSMTSGTSGTTGGTT